MNLFRVVIGKATRRGDLQALAERFVQTEMDRGEVVSHFGNEYKGFRVEAQHIETLETLPRPEVIKHGVTKTEIVYSVDSLKVDLTEAEANQLILIKEAVEVATRNEDRFLEAVEDRIQKSPWLDSYTKVHAVREGCGVFIKNARLNFNVVKESIATPLQN